MSDDLEYYEDELHGDYRDLIEQARLIHRPIATERCRRCAGDWPCLTSRLADALERAAGVIWDLNETISKQAVAGREDFARAERLAPGEKTV